MQLISKYNKGIRYLLCAIDLFSKYVFAVYLKDKKGTTFVNAFQSILQNSKRKPNKTWVDQGSEFHNTHFKKWLKENNIEMYSAHNEGKSVVTERFIRTLKKTYHTYHKTIKIKPIDVEMILLPNIMKNLMKKSLKLK